MSISSPLVRHLLSNLRVSFFVLVIVAILVFGWALVRGVDADWNIVLFTGIGMFASSFLNALYDAKRERR